MAKIQFSITLSPEVWAQVDNLIPAFGGSRGEVITHALNVWWGADVDKRKTRIDALKPQIEKLIQDDEIRQQKVKERKKKRGQSSE